MNYLEADQLAKDLGERVLFQNLSLSINQGDKIALIAKNGSGKSSLLKILAGVDEPDAGTVRIRKGLKMAYLSQEPDLNGALTIQQLIDTSNTQLMSVIRRYELAVEAQSEHFSESNQRELELASLAMDEAGAWDFERRLKELLTKFNINEFNQKISNLSGGQRKRLAISITLLEDPDLLLLDEPTNHLDLEMIEWLEHFLNKSHTSILMVTHDRYFLDAVCNQILELKEEGLQLYKGNYAYFLEKKAELELSQQIEISKARQQLKSELEWMRRSPKARTTKSKSRISAYYELEDKAKSGKREQELNLSVKMTRIGGKILELKKVNKTFGNLTILQGFDYVFKKGERIGIVGKNGVGKSTFLNLIMDKVLPDSGKIVHGDTIVYGYYSQEGMQFKEGKKVLEVLTDVADVITLANGSKVSASQMLNLFMFPPQMQHQAVDKLSGGEKRRLYLLTVLMKNPNFLILDEPTNDLDILTLNKLEEFLLEFGGCLILVSHDRYFLDRLVDHLFIFEGQGAVRDYNGSYSEYRCEEEEKLQEVKIERKKAELKQDQQKAGVLDKLSFKEKFELEQIEISLASLESEKVKLEEELNNQQVEYTRLLELTEKLSAVMDEIDAKTERWMELQERA